MVLLGICGTTCDMVGSGDIAGIVGMVVVVVVDSVGIYGSAADSVGIYGLLTDSIGFTVGRVVKLTGIFFSSVAARVEIIIGPVGSAARSLPNIGILTASSRGVGVCLGGPGIYGIETVVPILGEINNGTLMDGSTLPLTLASVFTVGVLM